MQTLSAIPKINDLNQSFTDDFALNFGAAFRLTMPVGNYHSVELTAPINLIMVLNGEVGINNAQTVYSPSSLLIVNAGFCHFENVGMARDAVILCLSLEQNWLVNFKQRYQALVTSVIEQGADDITQQLTFGGCDLTRMAMTGLDQLLNDNQMSNLICLKIEELLLLQLNKPQSGCLIHMLVERCDPATERFRRFVEANYLNDWSLEQFAKEIGMSLTAFKTSFNQIYHTSPRAWFNEQRLTYAEHLLHTSQMRVIDIAVEAGFSSQSYFTQAFKTRFGMTPKQARK